MSSGLWRARPAQISWAAVTVQTWLTAVCRSISRRRSVGRILRLGSCFLFVRYATSRLICRPDGLTFRRSFVCRNQERPRLGNRLLLYVDKWISQRHVCSVYSGPGAVRAASLFNVKEREEVGYASWQQPSQCVLAAVASVISRKPSWFSRSKGYRTHITP